MAFDGLAIIAQGGVGLAQVTQPISFVPYIPNFASYFKCLIVVLNSLSDIADMGVSYT